MKTTTLISEGANYTALNIGKLDEVSDYIYQHPKMNREIQGKLFMGEKLKTTSLEISFQVLPPHAEIPFIHKHNAHEEVYMVLKGNGQFRIDDEIFNVQEGSIIRVAPEGKRIWRNNSDMPIIVTCIQAIAGSFKHHFGSDGALVNEEIKWNS
jgi:mannose-6-phosphate isomerase-like protein (cupin superfamily)